MSVTQPSDLLAVRYPAARPGSLRRVRTSAPTPGGDATGSAATHGGPITLLPSWHRTRTVRVAVELVNTVTVFMQLTVVTIAVLNVPLAAAPYFAGQ